MDINGAFTSFVVWLKDIWEKINIKEWAKNIGGSSSEAVQAAIYFGVGFAVGFLFKKYFKFLFGCLVTSVLLILILEYNKILEIDWQALNVLVGFEPTTDFGFMMNSAFDWVKDNMIVSISAVVGFLIGYKLG